MVRKPDGFPIPNSNGIVGNVYWGESLTVVTCDFPGLNKVITYCQMNASSSALTSVKKTRSLDNLFVFKEPKKSLKKTPLGLFSR